MTVDVDCGVTVVKRRRNTHKLPMAWEMILSPSPMTAINYTDLSENRDMFLRLVTMAELDVWLSGGEDDRNCKA